MMTWASVCSTKGLQRSDVSITTLINKTLSNVAALVAHSHFFLRLSLLEKLVIPIVYYLVIGQPRMVVFCSKNKPIPACLEFQ